MKRSTPLKRRTPLRSRGKTKYRRRPRDVDHMMKVKRLPCIVSVVERMPVAEKERLAFKFMYVTLCGGPVQADHMGMRGMGQKADDRTCGPLCRNHHAERTDYRGVFRGFRGISMRVFCDWTIEWTTKQVEEMSRG